MAGEAPRDETIDLWPAVVWIAAGIWQFSAVPELFAWWMGAAYFLLGAPVMLLVTGTATARMRATLLEMVREVFPARDRFTRLVATLLRVMLAAVEGMLILTVARGAFMLLV